MIMYHFVCPAHNRKTKQVSETYYLSDSADDWLELQFGTIIGIFSLDASRP